MTDYQKRLNKEKKKCINGRIVSGLDMFPELMSTADAAAWFGVSVSTIRKWINNGTLKAFRPEGSKIIRISKKDCEVLANGA